MMLAAEDDGVARQGARWSDAVSEEPLIWHIVHTRRRAERMVQLALHRSGYDTLWLHYQALVSHARRKIAVLRPLFPRYVFIGLEVGQSLYQANTAPGVSTVLYRDDRPFEVPLETIADLRRRGDEAGRVDAPLRSAVPERSCYPAGTPVNIVDGPLKGLPAVVQRDDGGAEVQVAVTLFGERSLTATTAYTSLRVVTDAVARDA